MAEIKLRIVGFPQKTDILQESIINAESIRDIVQYIEMKYPPDYYTFTIFLNGANADDKSSLRDGDEVTVVPVMSGG